MRRAFYLTTFVTLAITFSLPSYATLITSVFINEVHYDNIDADVNEFIELAGLAGTDLTGWKIQLYNGAGGGTYASPINLTGIFSNDVNGFGFISFDKKELQNGPSDGIALINDENIVVQFLSYEGTLTATNGIAINKTSIDIGVMENEQTSVNASLQLTGTGYRYQDFVWQISSNHTKGKLNLGQTISYPVSEPDSVALWLTSTLIMVTLRRKMKHPKNKV
jgi:hypothetical protein